MRQKPALFAVLTLALALCIAVAGPRVIAASSNGLISTDKGVPGTPIQVTPAFAYDTTCTVKWDDAVVTRFKCGSAKGDYPSTAIDAQGSPGWHTITVCDLCGSDKGGRGERGDSEDSADFLVLSVVPDLSGLSLDGDGGARAAVAAAGLVVGKVDGPTKAVDAVVVSQVQDPHSAATPGSDVDFTVDVPHTNSPPTLVRVPPLKRFSIDDARATLSAVGLTMRTSGSRTGIVVDQTPQAGESVRPGFTVTVIVGQIGSSTTATSPTTSTNTGSGSGSASNTRSGSGSASNTRSGSGSGTNAQSHSASTSRTRPTRSTGSGQGGSGSGSTTGDAGRSVAGSGSGTAIIALACLLIALLVGGMVLRTRRVTRHARPASRPRARVVSRAGTATTDITEIGSASDRQPSMEIRYSGTTTIEIEEPPR